MNVDRKAIFDAVRTLRNGQKYTLADVQLLDAAIDRAFANVTPQAVPLPSGRQVSQRGIDLIHSFEGCKLATYKDPGSSNGLPITGGWGSTKDEHGNPLKLGFTAPLEYWNRLFAAELAGFAAKVAAMIGEAFTDQSMFDALVSFSYNVGIEALRKSTLLKKHKEGDHLGAAAQFGKWVLNDGKPMRGLVLRRAAESALYLADG